MLFNGSDYRYACPDATQKGSVCHSNDYDMGLVVWWLGVTAAMLMVLCSTLTLSTLLFSGLRVTFTG